MDKQDILATLSTFNNQLTQMQRQVIALITSLSTPEEAPTAAPSAPLAVETPEPEPAPLLSEHDKNAMVKSLQKFLGTGSLFHKHLSPEVLVNAKGFLKPGLAGLQQYQEDIAVLGVDKLVKWPTGFYRNRDNKHVQFFVNTPGALVYVDTSPEGLREPVVVLAPDAEHAAKRHLTDLQPVAIDALAAMLEEALLALNDKIAQPSPETA